MVNGLSLPPTSLVPFPAHKRSHGLDLRKAAVMPWEWMVDEARPNDEIKRWVDPAGFAGTAPLYYSLDFWREQRIRLLAMLGKARQMPVYLHQARERCRQLLEGGLDAVDWIERYGQN